MVGEEGREVGGGWGESTTEEDILYYEPGQTSPGPGAQENTSAFLATRRPTNHLLFELATIS